MAHALQLLHRASIPLPTTRTPMKLPFILLPTIFLATAALADPQSQAAALLSRPHAPVNTNLVRSSSVSETAIDAHALAEALLSGQRIARQTTMSAAIREHSYGPMPADAHSQAAALLSGTRTSAGS